MIKSQLREYIARIVDARAMAADDVKELQRQVLPDGLASRAEAEALLDLDREVRADESWDNALKALVVDFVIWGTRPTGKVAGDDARWLVGVLDGRAAPRTARRLAEAVVDEADQVDEALVHLVLRGRREAARNLAA